MLELGFLSGFYLSFAAVTELLSDRRKDKAWFFSR
jgi:hypothetical protein